MKDIDKSKKEYSEEEAILLSIQCGGFDGSEFNTKIWKTSGRLELDRTQKALMKKLRTIANTVELKLNEKGKPLRGKNRVYIIKNWKESQTKMESNRKGTPLSREDIIMKEYIFNKLLTLHIESQDMNKTIGNWSIAMGLEDVRDINTNECTSIIEQLHEDSDYEKISKHHITQLFIHKVYDRNSDAMKLSFKHLEKEGRITISEELYGRDRNGEVEKISLSEYDSFCEKRRVFMEDCGVTVNYYNRARHSFRKNMKQLDIIKKFESFALENSSGIVDVFKTVSVDIASTSKSLSIYNSHEFMEAFYNKFFRLIDHQQSANEKSVQGRIYFTNKFYRMHMLILIESLGLAETPKDAIRKEIDSFKSRLNELIEDESEVERARRTTFGEFNEKEFPLSSIQ